MKRTFLVHAAALLAVMAMASCKSKAAPASDFSRELTEDGTGVVITKYNGTAENVVIPAKMEGYPVVRIGNKTFYKNATVKSVTVPDSVLSIDDGSGDGYGAFFECASLQSVTLGKSLQKIGACAFGECASLKSVAIPNSVTEIGEMAFGMCSSLKSVTLGKSVQAIGMGAFFQCASLKSVAIPDSVTEIGDGAFGSCESLKSVTLGKSLQRIGRMAFAQCPVLQSLAIPDSLQKITFGGGSNPFGAPAGQEFGQTDLPLATQSRLKALGYTGSF